MKYTRNTLFMTLLAFISTLSILVRADTPPQVINKLCATNTFFSQIQPGANNIQCTQPTYAGLANLPSYSASVQLSANNVSLVNDSNAPGNSKYYGTNSSGVRGFQAFPNFVTSIGTLDSQAPTANGGTVLGSTFYFQSATSLQPGLVNNTTQTFSGDKTISGLIAASNLSGTNTGDVTAAAFGSVPNANGFTLSNQVLNMQPADDTHPGGVNNAAQLFSGVKTFTSGLVSPSYSTTATNPASSGQLRLGNAETLSWRNAGNAANISLSVDSSNNFLFGSNLNINGNSIINTGTLTLPTTTDTLVGRATTDTLTNKSISGSTNTLTNIPDAGLSTSYVKADGTRALTGNWGAGAFSGTFNGVAVGSSANTVSGLATIINSGTLTLPTTTDTLVGRATTDTLLNKTLTAPVIATIVNSGTLTLPTSTDTLVARDTTDTLTNKSISGLSNTLSNIGDASLSTSYLKADGTRALTGNWAAGAFSGTFNSVQVGSAANTITGLGTIVNTGTLTLPTATDTLVGRATSDTLTNKTINASNNTLSNIVNSNLSGSAGITGANVATNTIANTNLAQMAANTLKGNNTGITANAADLTVAQVQTMLGSTVDVTLSAFGSSPNANAASLSGQALTLQPASASFPGGVSTTTQSFLGAKTFSTSALSPIFSSTTANPSSTGIFRLANTEAVSWRNAGNSADLALAVNASNALQFNSITLADLSSSQTLTNKILSGNTATNLVSGSGTLTLNTTGTITVPNATDTLVGKATTDVLTNKTLSGNTATNLISGSGTLTLNTSGTATVPNATDTLVGKATTDVFTNKSISGSTNTLTSIADGSLSTSYIKADGSRALTSNWAAGAFSGTFNGVAVGSAANTISSVSAVSNTAGVAISGTNTNDSAASGIVGEYKVTNSTATSVPATGTFGDLGSLSLTAGDWDCMVQAEINKNGATFSTIDVGVGISSTSGNSGTGLTNGNNFTELKTTTTTFTRQPITVIGVRVSLAATTTYYAKVFVDAYTVATPLADWRFSCRRVR